MPTSQFDAAVELQLDVLRTSASVRNDVLAILRGLEKDLVSEVANADYTAWGRARVTRQLNEVRAAIDSYYQRMATIAIGGTEGIAEVSAKVTGSALSITTEAVIPSASVLSTIASKSLVQGATQGDWWKRQSSDTAFRFSQAIRQGIAGAETNQRIISRVRGFMDTSRANAASLVQTSTATIANDARQAVYDENQDIIQGYRAVATLDTHTCPTCAPLDGLEWTKGQRARGHKFPYPNYPLHFNCRCLLIAVVLDGPQGGTRASDSGQVSADLTFSGWLKRQSPEKQADILGAGRAEMYRSGKITLTDLVTGKGRPLTLRELRTKYEVNE